MSVLDDILVGVAEDLEARMATTSLDDLKERAARQHPALDPMPAFRSDGVSVIAEVKRSSPSEGKLATIKDPAALAADYAAGGAAAISVLTEERRFKGSLADLEAVRAKVSIPVLRKDFIAEPYQVLEARASGADLVLLIVAALEQPVLAELHALVLELGMTPLVETHSGDELERAADLGARLIGVNARDLSTFELDRDLFGRLSERFPADAVKVAESAVLSADDVAHYRRSGADVVLVGEALVRDGDPRAGAEAIIAAGAPTPKD